jgi:tetratricopeptide (TPR) repeat protein
MERLKCVNLNKINFLIISYILFLIFPVSSPVFAQQGGQGFDYWTTLCSELKAQEKYEEALAACDSAIGLNNNDLQTWLERGDILFKLNRHADAVASYNEVLRLESNHSFALTKRCASLTELTNYQEAIDSCDQALKQDTQWNNQSPAFAWYYRGVALRKLGKIEEALVANDWAIQLVNHYSIALAERCLLLSEQNRYYEALGFCEQAINGDGNWENKTVSIAWIYQGQVLKQLQQYEEALNAYDRALALNPNDAETWTDRGLILEQLGRYAEALTAHEWAVKVNPKYSLALVNQCAVLNQLGNYEEALVACEMALQEGDQRWGDLGLAYAWNQRGNALIGLARYEEALASANRAFALQPDYAEAWSNRSAALWHLGRYPEALAATEQAISINPNSSKAWFNQGRILTTLGRYEDAFAAYDRALKGDANFGDSPNLADIWVNQSAVLWRLERYNEAVIAADRALGVNPQSANAWYNRALALMALRRYEEAVTTYNRAIEIDAKNADFWAGKGIALRFLEKYSDALPALEQALKLNPNHPQALQNRDYVQQKIKQANQPTP